VIFFALQLGFDFSAVEIGFDLSVVEIGLSWEGKQGEVRQGRAAAPFCMMQPLLYSRDLVPMEEGHPGLPFVSSQPVEASSSKVS